MIHCNHMLRRHVHFQTTSRFITVPVCNTTDITILCLLIINMNFCVIKNSDSLWQIMMVAFDVAGCI